MTTPHWTIVACPGTQLAESPRWAHGQLRWLDIPARRMHCSTTWTASSELSVTSLDLPDEIGCIVPTARSDRWIGLGRAGVWGLSDDEPALLLQAGPFDPLLQRFNDGRVDAAGRIWVSTLVDARTPADAHLYRIDGDSGDGDSEAQTKTHTAAPQIQQSLDGFTVGNGLAFAPDNRTLYVTDTTSRAIWKCAFDPISGSIKTREIFARYSDGLARPDGAAVSEDGHYWVAVFQGQRIDRWASDGTLVRSYPTPVACPTMPCFAGPDRKTLVVTSAGLARPEAERMNTPAGDLIMMQVDVAGTAEHLSRGI